MRLFQINYCCSTLISVTLGVSSFFSTSVAFTAGIPV